MDSFAHVAVIALTGGATSAAPGGAVTSALCGHWMHEGACVWPHHTSVLAREQTTVTVRVDFTCDAVQEDEVRALIRRALRGGAVVGPRGCETWTLIDECAA